MFLYLCPYEQAAEKVSKWTVNRGGRVCLDNLKEFLSDKLLSLMPLPVPQVVCSSKPHSVFCRQVLDVAASDCKTENTQ